MLPITVFVIVAVTRSIRARMQTRREMKKFNEEVREWLK